MDSFLAKKIKCELLKKLREKIDLSTYQIYRRTIDQNGQTQWYRLLDNMKEKGETLYNFLQKINLSPNTTFRILGFGHAFSDFFLQKFEDSRKNDLTHLGAVANFIVSIYDCILDNNMCEENPLSKEALVNLSKERAGIFRDHDNIIEETLLNLVNYYFSTLIKQCNDVFDKDIYNKISNIIFKMYDAETASNNSNGVLSNTHYMRKSALPFVIMGLSGWLLEKSEKLRWRMLCYMYRVGFFFGKIDDLVDYEEDYQKSAINSLLLRQSTQEHNILFNLWKEFSVITKNNQSNLKMELCKDNSSGNAENWNSLITVCTISWLGGHASN